ncbi:dihydroneopterin aldolase [Merismopedia glauca]|uniref:7,8-dihydroneopterin aldolase n=1 Tax=Merismopedia glauca CCAP 1448/3 TaxID=1296344 RepID=A0A2T1C6M8_9CYAN|nr:dihydroneopterin aldolase [Merismopedia glauca]PSB03818.1 dihydroneopterin aldolase [Merismopedia glauca CCAP 1448/3]
MDSIQLTGIRYYGYTGYLPEERVLGQWFEVDLTIWLDLATAGQSDAIEDTFDYRGAIAAIKQLITTSKFSLIERLASAIAESVLEFPQVKQVQVRLTKVAPPIPDFTGKISIEIVRTQI